MDSGRITPHKQCSSSWRALGVREFYRAFIRNGNTETARDWLGLHVWPYVERPRNTEIASLKEKPQAQCGITCTEAHGVKPRFNTWSF